MIRVLAITPHYQKVVDFMEKAGQDCPKKPTVPDFEVRKLRAKLILEEALETICALGIQPLVRTEMGVAGLYIEGVTFQDDPLAFNMVEVIDGCCDVKVVTTGTLIACGIPDVCAQDLVDESNLAKFGPGGYRREDGKWIKPDDWIPPAIAEFLTNLQLATG